MGFIFDLMGARAGDGDRCADRMLVSPLAERGVPEETGLAGELINGLGSERVTGTGTDDNESLSLPLDERLRDGREGRVKLSARFNCVFGSVKNADEGNRDDLVDEAEPMVLSWRSSFRNGSFSDTVSRCAGTTRPSCCANLSSGLTSTSRMSIFGKHTYSSSTVP